MRRAVALGLALSGCGGGLPPCDDSEFVAFASDFDGWAGWRRIALDGPDPRLGAGPRVVYVNALPPAGARTFPRCTMILKTTERGDDPARWFAVGMAKRGGDYNAAGALGWEWFDIDLTGDGDPMIDWRGPVPPEGRGYECVLGEDDGAAAEAIGDCNTCHAAAAGNDYVISVPLGG